MRKFEYVLTNPLGLHARPAGLIVKESGGIASRVTVIYGEKQVSGERIFDLLCLGAKQGDLITFEVIGEDEESAAIALEQLVQDF